MIGLRQGGAPTYMWIHSNPRSFALPSCFRRCSPLLSLLSKFPAVTCAIELRCRGAFRLYLVLCGGVGAFPLFGVCPVAAFVLLLSPWVGSRSRLVLALGLCCAVVLLLGDRWVEAGMDNGAIRGSSHSLWRQFYQVSERCFGEKLERNTAQLRP